MRTISCVVLLTLFGNLYFSKAQNVKLRNDNRQPIEGAVVTYAAAATPGQYNVVFSNSRGEIPAPVFNYPIIRRIVMLGYLERTDTLPAAGGQEEIVLVPAPKSMGEVTFTGNLLPGYQKDAVVPVQVLKAQDIEKRGAVTVRDLLTQELNLRIGFDPALGSNLTMQGTGGEHIKILIDGVPVIGRQNGNIDLGQLNLSNIERVEVIRGPMSVLYGTDALGGVINLITKTPAKQQWSAGASGFYESSGQYNTEATLNLGLKSTTIALNGGRNFFDGFDPQNSEARSQLWNPREQYFANVKLTQSIGTLKLGFQSAYFNEMVTDKSNPVVTPYFAYAYDVYYNTIRFNHQLTAEKKFTNRGVLQFTGAWSTYEYIRNTKRKDMVSLSEILTEDPGDDDTTRFRAAFSRATYAWAAPGSRWSILAGTDINLEEGRGKKIDNNVHSMTDVAAYASIDFKPTERITLRPAVRAIYNSQFNAPLVPSFNVLVKISPTLNGRASFARGYRAPSLKEQHLFFVDGNHNVRGNRDLTPENSSQVNLGAEWRYTAQDQLFILEPMLFYNDIRNKISLALADPATVLYTYINLDRFNTRGAEIKARYVHKQLAVNYGFAYTGTWGTFEGDVRQPEIAWYPETNAGADYTIRKTKTVIALFWKYFGRQPVFIVNGDNQTQRFENESFQLMDVSLKQNLLKDRISLTMGVRNILGVTNVRAMSSGGVHSGGSNSAPIAMGQTIFTKLTYNFK